MMMTWRCPHGLTSQETCLVAVGDVPPCGRRVLVRTYERLTPRLGIRAEPGPIRVDSRREGAIVGA